MSGNPLESETNFSMEDRVPQTSSETTVASLIAADTLWEMIDNYHREIDRLADAHIEREADPDLKFVKKCRGRLKAFDGMKTLALIWKESSMVTNKECVEAGIEKSFDGGAINYSTLAMRFTEEYGPGNLPTGKYLRLHNATRGRVTETVDAAVEFGLAKITTARDNLKIIEATPELAMLMESTHFANAAIMVDRFGGAECQETQP